MSLYLRSLRAGGSLLMLERGEKGDLLEWQLDPGELVPPPLPPPLPPKRVGTSPHSEAAEACWAAAAAAADPGFLPLFFRPGLDLLLASASTLSMVLVEAPADMGAAADAAREGISLREALVSTREDSAEEDRLEDRASSSAPPMPALAVLDASDLAQLGDRQNWSGLRVLYRRSNTGCTSPLVKENVAEAAEAAPKGAFLRKASLAKASCLESLILDPWLLFLAGLWLLSLSDLGVTDLAGMDLVLADLAGLATTGRGGGGASSSTAALLSLRLSFLDEEDLDLDDLGPFLFLSRPLSSFFLDLWLFTLTGRSSSLSHDASSSSSSEVSAITSRLLPRLWLANLDPLPTDTDLILAYLSGAGGDLLMGWSTGGAICGSSMGGPQPRCLPPAAGPMNL